MRENSQSTQLSQIYSGSYRGLLPCPLLSAGGKGTTENI